MELLLWFVAINWGVPLLGYTLYALITWLVLKDYIYMGFQFPCFKLRLVNEEEEEEIVGDPIEPWHARMWKDWGGHGGLLWIFYKDRDGSWDDDWAKRTVTHELRHGLQELILGLLMIVLYLLHMGFIYLFQKNKHPYLDCWFERDARRKAGQQVDVPPDRWPNGGNDRWPWW